MRAAFGMMLALAPSCFVPTLQIDESAQGGGGDASGGSGVTLACDELFPYDDDNDDKWPEACTDCIRGSVCCDHGAVGDCAGDPLCAEAALCMARELHPAGAWRCTEDHGLVGYQSYFYALACARERCGAECFGATWSCVDGWSPPDSPGTSSDLYDVTIRIAEIEEGTLPGQVPCRACEADTTCAPPLDETVSTPWGGAVFQLSLPFDGYFELDESDGNVAFRIFLPKLWAATDIVALGPSPESITRIIMNKGISLVPGKAHLLVHVTDCTVEPARDVDVAVVGQETLETIYLDGTAVELATATTATGDAAIFNVDLDRGSTIAVTGTWKGDEVARATIQLVADEYAYVRLEPTRAGQ